MADKTILVVGTYDTKDDELGYMAQVHPRPGRRRADDGCPRAGRPVRAARLVQTRRGRGGRIVDPGGHRQRRREHRDADHGARRAALALRLYREGRFDGVVVLGGTMGTDLALDLCQALPLGVPKYVVSTVSFSP